LHADTGHFRCGATTSRVYTRTPGTAWTSLGGATIGGVALASP